MQLDEDAIPGVILAGGQGRRIGGSKATVVLGGQPLWRHVVTRIGPQVSALAINATDGFEGYRVLRDEVPGLGPLGGILAALIWARRLGARRVLTVAVDTPFLPLDLVKRLSGPSAPVVMAQTSDGVHATTAIWDAGLADRLEAALTSGTRKVTDWAMSQAAARVPFADTVPPAFFNINTAEDLAQAEAWL